MRTKSKQLGLFVIIWFCSAFAESRDFLSYITEISSSENTIRGPLHIWMQKEANAICCTTGDTSTRKLILHQASSIFLGSGSRGKRSLDTKRMACSARPHGGLYGKKRLRSPPASRLPKKKNADHTYIQYIIHTHITQTYIIICQYLFFTCTKWGNTCFLAPPKTKQQGLLNKIKDMLQHYL